MSSIKNKIDKTESAEIDLGRLIGELIDHRKIIISVTSIFVLIALVYALFATPIYQSDALVQVEQKQGNAILSSLSQVLPNVQPQSAPEVALLQSRMILGKSVEDLNLQALVTPEYFPIFGEGWARLLGEKPGSISVSRFSLFGTDDDIDSIYLTVKDKEHYVITGNGYEISGKVGEQLKNKNLLLEVNEINAVEGSRFKITYMSRLRAISLLQKNFTIEEQGKDTGILSLSLVGEDPELITKILNNITTNYLMQNIDRQAAQDEKSLEFLNKQLPKVRSDLDIAEDKLNDYRRTKDSVDLTLEAKSVLDQIVNVENQLNELTFRESEISQLYTSIQHIKH